VQFATPTGVAVIDADTDSLPLLRSLLTAGAFRLEALHTAAAAEELLSATGLPYQLAATPAAAAAGSGIYISRDDLAAIAAQGVSVVVLGGSNPAAGLARALSALEFSRRVREANPPCAALVGPLLQRRAADAGADYRIEPLSVLGRAAALVQAQQPPAICPGSDVAELAACVVLSGMFGYRLTEQHGRQVLLRPGAALPTELPAAAAQNLFFDGRSWSPAAADTPPNEQAFPPLRRVLELVAQVVDSRAADGDQPHVLTLQPQLVSAAAADRDGLVPWPCVGWPLRAAVVPGALLRWDDLLYMATDPTIRMVLLQRRLIAAEEAE
jgi:hypothetical protein